jgi:hypothetical protein
MGEDVRRITMGQRDGEMKFKVDPISRAEQVNRKPNFEVNGKLYLVRCYSCDFANGRENHVGMVAASECAHCGWSDRNAL